MNSVKRFVGYGWGTLAHPAPTFRNLSKEGDIKQGWAAALLVTILYSVVCAIAAIRGIETVEESNEESV